MNKLVKQSATKYFVCDDLGCDFMLVDEVLHFRPHNEFSRGDEEFYPVEPKLVGDEVVTFEGKNITLREVYKQVKKKLGEN